METMASLLAKNGNFNRKYGIMPSDLERCNTLIEFLEGTRSNTKPIPGDRIQCVGPKKSYMEGHFDHELEKEWGGQICVRPSVPFISAFMYRPIQDAIDKDVLPHFSTSGGYWIGCKEVEMYEYIGKCMKIFCVWGNSGACAGGAVHFEAEVNVWRIFMESIY